MATVTYVTKDGLEIIAEDAIGNLMEIALENDVEAVSYTHLTLPTIVRV